MWVITIPIKKKQCSIKPTNNHALVHSKSSVKRHRLPGPGRIIIVIMKVSGVRAKKKSMVMIRVSQGGHGEDGNLINIQVLCSIS